MSPEEHIAEAESLMEAASRSLTWREKFSMHLAIAAVQKGIPDAVSLLK
jgi:hypothetical protein